MKENEAYGTAKSFNSVITRPNETYGTLELSQELEQDYVAVY